MYSAKRDRCIVAEQKLKKIGKKLAPEAPTRIQLCGRLVVRVRGRRIEEALPGRQGRLLFAYLVAHRRHASPRPKLIEALWPERPPAAADTALNALLTKVRTLVGRDGLMGKHDVRLVLPPDSWVDVEAATEALHRAESAISAESWAGAWGPARVALHITLRTFLSGYEAPWIDDRRCSLEDVLLRAHECVAASGLGLGGVELASAERSGRDLVKLAPYRETGHRFLMQVLARKGDVAEALLIYENLRRMLREELGASPGPATQAVHMRLLGHAQR
jgi:SARP family transcriptional regulator, regulator of embCAB operon